jgi:hypothetical protein
MAPVLGSAKPAGRIVAMTALLGLAALALSSCSDIAPIATVDGEPAAYAFQVAAIVDELDRYQHEAAAQLEEEAGEPVPDSFELPRDELESAVLSQLVAVEVSQQQLADRGDEVTDADREAAEEQLRASGELVDVDLPDELRQRSLDQLAVQAALQRSFVEEHPVEDADVRQAYEEAPDVWGMRRCGSLLALRDEALIVRVRARWERQDPGDSWEAIVADLQEDPATADPRSGDFGCLTGQEAQERFGGAIGEVFDELPAGSISDQVIDIGNPDDETFATTIVYIESVEPVPFEDVEDDIRAALESVAALEGSPSAGAQLGEVDVWVDPTYGTWDAETMAIVPEGGSTERFVEIGEEIRA